MAKINVREYSPKSIDSFFFDTNVWLLLFGDIADFQKKAQKNYSALFQTILDRDYTIFLTSNVISEFANVLLRRAFNEWQSLTHNIGKDFKKDFVGSATYIDQVELITILIRKINNLPCTEKIPDNFNAINLNKILNTFKVIDFNDCYIAEICQLKGLKLVTNDRDFFNLQDDLDVISFLA